MEINPELLFGKNMRDELTGFAGKCIGMCRYLYGEDQLLIQPECTDNNKFAEAEWISAGRLWVVDDNGRPEGPIIEE